MSVNQQRINLVEIYQEGNEIKFTWLSSLSLKKLEEILHRVCIACIQMRSSKETEPKIQVVESKLFVPS